MTTTLNAPAALDERLVDAAVGALELFAIHLGRRLGLYEHLVEPVTAPELAGAAGIDLRYSREWLEQQAVAGLVNVTGSESSWERRRYHVDLTQQALLIHADDPSHVSPLADMVAGIGMTLERIAAAYRTGAGVPYSGYGATFRDGQAGINRPAFTHDLVGTWLDAVPDLRDRLDGGGRIADIGCGAGWSTIALALAFPEADVVGIDADVASIADARRNAAAEGANVRFEVADATTLDPHERYDLIVVLEALHDMAQPTAMLQAARNALAPGGAVLVADEKVAPEFTAPGDQLERMMYGWSVVHCLPAAMAERPSAAIGTVLRSSLLETLAIDAGFLAVQKSDIDAGFFDLYVLRP